MSGRLGGLALSVDGTETGIFLEDVSGARGQIVVAPGGRSSAQILFGAAYFDTGLALSNTRFRLKDRPPPLGGVVSPTDSVSFRVVGGDKDRVNVEMIGYGTDDLHWVTPPKLTVPCDGLKWGSWPPEPFPVTKGRLFPDGVSEVGFRAEKTGPVVVNIALKSAEELERSGDMVKVVAWLTIGRAIGWTEAKSWTSTPPVNPKPADNLGSGSGRMGGASVSCPRGAPLYLRKGDSLYEVGRLRSDGEEWRKEEYDWRQQGAMFVLEARFRNVPDVVPWFELHDEFRVTNYFWHSGVKGSFVVPRGPGACELAPPKSAEKKGTSGGH